MHTPDARSSRPVLRIALADDHAIVRLGYRRLLEGEDHVQVVAEYSDAEQAWQDLSQRPSDFVQLLVLDLSMPGRSGLDLLRQLRQHCPSLDVLVFTMHDTATLRAQALRAGACAFVGKSEDPEELLKVVRQHVQRVQHTQRRDGTATPVALPTESRPATAPHHELTARELEAMMLMLEGLPLDRVAHQMGVSDKTVSNYQTSIRQKLGIGSAMELLRYAQRHNLMP